MSLIFRDIVGIIDHTRRFDSRQEIDDPNNWSFQYATQNTSDRYSDITFDGGEPDYDKSHYPSDTIFFDSSNFEIYVNSDVKNVVIDNTPPKYRKSNVYYTTVQQDHKCKFVFESDTYLDIKQISIKCGDIDLYTADRKTGIIKCEPLFISDIYLDKKENIYTLSFTIADIAEFLKKLTDEHLSITVWDLAGNSCTHVDKGKWVGIDDDEDLTELQQLIIEFIEIKPENRILDVNTEGEVTVRIYNPNKSYWPIQPQVELIDKSVGVIDENTLSYKDTEGVLSFKVTNITECGSLNLHTWIAVENTAIYEVVKTSTENTATLGPWIATEEGRLYNFKRYVPTFLSDAYYKDWIEFVEQFMNSCYTSLNSGKYISILEKIARINNFNDIQAIERKLLDQFKTTYNVEVNPNMEDLKVYLENKTVNVETTYTTTEDEDLSDSEETPEGVTVHSRSSDPVVTTTTTTTTTSAYKNPLTLDDVNEMMRFVYKTIPYYNQIKGTRNGIKMILNTMGLCVKLVDVWSESKTISNTENINLERRADELQAEIYDEDYDSIDIDIGKFYLTSRFDVDLSQTDLTFREFNKLAKNIVNIIFQVKPLTRVLRKLSYIFSANTNLHFKYFSLVDANRQQYHCFDYIWDLFDEYSLSKSIHDVNYRTCNKLFVPFKAKYAQVTYNAGSNHSADNNPLSLTGNGPSTITEGQTITRMANKNTFHNLCNIEHKLSLSNESVLRLYYGYFEKRKMTTITKVTDPATGETTLDMTSEYKLYCNDQFVQDLNSNPSYDIFTFFTVEGYNDKIENYNLLIPRQAKITSQTNGFTIDLDRASIAILRKSSYRKTLNEIIKTVEQVDVNTVKNIEIEPVGMFVMFRFAIPLGTNFITQFIGSGDDITIINPETDDRSDSPEDVISDMSKD